MADVLSPVLPPAMQHQFSNGIPYSGGYQPQGNFGSASFMEPLKQRRISHPNLAVSRPGYAAPAPVDTIHQNMMAPQQQLPRNAMPTQEQTFQNTMPGSRGMSFSDAPAVPTAVMPPMPQQQQQVQQPVQQQMQQPVHQQMQQQMYPMQQQMQPPTQQQLQQIAQMQSMQPMLQGVPQTVPMAPPLHDELAQLTHHLQDMRIAALPGQVPHLRRQSEPFPRGCLQPGLGPLLDRDFLDELDEFEEHEMVRRQLQRGHRASAPPPIAHVPYYQPAHRGAVALNANPHMVNAPMMNQAMVGNAMNNAMVNLMTHRPYSYETDQYPNAGMYPEIHRDLQALSMVTQMQSTERIEPLIDILVQRTPTEIDTLRKRFRAMHGGSDLGTAFNHLVSNERQSVKYATMGLVLGPVLFDLWLVQRLDGSHDDLLIDIFIGRDTEDMRFLLFKFHQQQEGSMTGRSMSSVLDAATSSDELRSALSIATENMRQDGTYPVDPTLVHRDYEEIIKIMNAGFPSHTALFNILLRRSNDHLLQLSIRYRIMREKSLDEDIRRCAAMSRMMRKIAVHAVRSATDPTYRDVMALKDAMGANSMVGNGSSEKLAIRIVRLHWYKQHWMQVKAAYVGHNGKALVDKVNGQRGLLRHLLVTMCLV